MLQVVFELHMLQYYPLKVAVSRSMLISDHDHMVIKVIFKFYFKFNKIKTKELE